MIEVWHKDNMAGNVLIGVSTALLASVLSANRVEVLTQVKIICQCLYLSDVLVLLATLRDPEAVNQRGILAKYNYYCTHCRELQRWPWLFRPLIALSTG